MPRSPASRPVVVLGFRDSCGRPGREPTRQKPLRPPGGFPPGHRIPHRGCVPGFTGESDVVQPVGYAGTLPWPTGAAALGDRAPASHAPRPFRSTRGSRRRGHGARLSRLRSRAGREVAVKTLKSQFSSDERAILRFKREAEAVGLFSHPALVPVYEVHGEYIVQELVDGESLAARLLREGSIPPPRPCAFSRRWRTASTTSTRAASFTAT